MRAIVSGLRSCFSFVAPRRRKNWTELGEFGRRSFHVASGAEIDFFVDDRLDGLAIGALVTLRK